MDRIEIRIAQRNDIQAMLDIYNYEVEHGVATLDLNKRTLAEWTEWFDLHNKDNHPLYVAELNGNVAGYASLSPYRDKEAYRSTVELSVYVAPKERGKGIADHLLQRVLEDARADKRTHLVVSVITSGNEKSTKLHEKFGFAFHGTIPDVGEKFGVYQSIDNYSLIVSDK